MKTMTCRQLGGACDQVFQANTFEEIAQISLAHGKEMAIQQDAEHLTAMNDMGNLMQDPQAMQGWMDQKKKQFEELPEE